MQDNVIYAPHTGDTPHQILKDFVAEYTQSTEFNRVFDIAFEKGQELGTAAYDQCIQIILETIGIPEALAVARLKEKGVILTN